ncbi:MAG: hypothetical protein JXB18_03840 [Sedimentisphaerales bacterium]|nr:hypothetical protein [Sedimentisphaerales bacterium]
MRGKYQFGLLFAAIAICGCQSDEKQAPVQQTAEKQTFLKMTCHVNFYRDTSIYVTEQEHLFNPASKSLQISSKEPSGRFIWSLQDDHYTVNNLNSAKTKDNLYNKTFLQAIYYGMLSSAQLITDEQVNEEETVRIEGKWYIPYLLNKQDAKIRLMKNKANDRFEQIILQKEDQIYQVICYNLRFDKDLDKNLPRTIDVFDATNGLSSKHLLMKVQYHTASVIN